MVINICIGFVYGWSVFQKPLMGRFNGSTAEISLTFTLIMAASALPMALAGKVQEYVEPRQVILAGGVLMGIGVVGIGYSTTIAMLYVFGFLTGLAIGIVYPGTVANMVRFFPDRKGLAAGFLAAGMGAGAVVLAPLAADLIQRYGVMDTFKLLGFAFFVTICGLSRLIPTAPENYQPVNWTSESGRMAVTAGVDKNWREMLGEPLFYILATMFTAAAISGMMIMGHASPIAQETLKVSAQEAAALVGFLALSNMLGRMFWGWLSDKTGRYSVMMAMYGLMGAAMLTLSQADGINLFVPAMLSVAFGYGGFMGMMASVTADSFGMKYLGVNFGIMFLTIAIAAFVGPRLAAVVKEAQNGDYSLAFLIATAFCILGIGLTIEARRREKTVSCR
jgi:OFA family oxalate/formate antiporter-like MFS transporter